MKFNLFVSQGTNATLLVIDGKPQLLFPQDLNYGATPSAKWQHITTINREIAKPAIYKSHSWIPLCTSAAEAKFTYGAPDGIELYTASDLDELATSRSKNVERVARCRAKLKRVELLFKPEEYDRLKANADAEGETVAGYIKKAIATKEGENE